MSKEKALIVYTPSQFDYDRLMKEYKRVGWAVTSRVIDGPPRKFEKYKFVHFARHGGTLSSDTFLDNANYKVISADTALVYLDEQFPEDGTVTDKYRKCNHHHKITDEQNLVDFGEGEFVADKLLVPLLKALNEAGLRTRTHCCGHHKNNKAFVSILLDEDVCLEIRSVHERDSDRCRYNGKQEVLISWSLKGLQK